jgi:hypothetical protein
MNFLFFSLIKNKCKNNVKKNPSRYFICSLYNIAFSLQFSLVMLFFLPTLCIYLSVLCMFIILLAFLN